MSNLEQALAEITNIRSQLAAGTVFRGFSPTVIAITGGLALATASAQSIWSEALANPPETFLICWIVTAIVSTCLIGALMVARSRRHHGGLADAMIMSAVERFLPSGFAGAVIALVFMKFAPEALWTLPGLWQILIALGIFTAARTLPRAISLVGAWYFVAGVGALIISSLDQSLSPWIMGLPFALGQFLMAAILQFTAGENPGGNNVQS